MAGMTPKPKALQRPSYGGLGASPGVFAKSVSAADHRKASYNALVGQAPQTPSAHAQIDDFQIGDVVDVPGDMYGTVKFVGEVRGKNGHFLGVELDSEFAGRGKNDGDVDGEHYFTTTIPGSGIFLPTSRATRRQLSPGIDSIAGSPATPAAGAAARSRNVSSSTASKGPRLAQTMGPGSGVGARPSSPLFKSSRSTRPSLARPESPLRRGPNLQPTSASTTARQFSKTVRSGTLPPGSPAASRVTTPAKKPATAGQTPRPYSRTGSRLGQHSETASDAFNGRASISNRGHGKVPSFSHPLRSPSRPESTTEHDEIAELRRQLAEKDGQLESQHAQVIDMEATLKELSAMLPANDSALANERGTGDEASLMRLLKEKDEKYNKLLAEYDASRADFKGTIDAMEAGIQETERMYEERNAKYEAEIEDLRAAKHTSEDMESMETIASQLKSLEDLVAELEEGLEDARRGEAEARGEVEHLRGEVERTKFELARAREEAAERTGGQNSKAPPLHSPPASTSRSPSSAQRASNALVDGAGEVDLPVRTAVTQQDSDLGHGDSSPLAEKSKAAATAEGSQESKKAWCAMCEKDGHFAYDCPEETY